MADNKVSYRREGWTDKRIDRSIRKGEVYVRRMDVGRPGHHYINMYYKGKPGRGTLVKTTYHGRKQSSRRSPRRTRWRRY